LSNNESIARQIISEEYTWKKIIDKYEKYFQKN